MKATYCWRWGWLKIMRRNGTMKGRKQVMMPVVGFASCSSWSVMVQRVKRQMVVVGSFLLRSRLLIQFGFFCDWRADRLECTLSFPASEGHCKWVMCGFTTWPLPDLSVAFWMFQISEVKFSTSWSVIISSCGERVDTSESELGNALIGCQLGWEGFLSRSL